MKVRFLKCTILMFFSLLLCKNRKSRSQRKNGNIKRKIYTEKRINTFLKDIHITLNNHGRQGLLSFLNFLPILVLLI